MGPSRVCRAGRRPRTPRTSRMEHPAGSSEAGHVVAAAPVRTFRNPPVSSTGPPPLRRRPAPPRIFHHLAGPRSAKTAGQGTSARPCPNLTGSLSHRFRHDGRPRSGAAMRIKINFDEKAIDTTRVGNGSAPRYIHTDETDKHPQPFTEPRGMPSVAFVPIRRWCRYYGEAVSGSLDSVRESALFASLRTTDGVGPCEREPRRSSKMPPANSRGAAPQGLAPTQWSHKSRIADAG